MKQLLFLILFPCLALAQYPGNGNQKITLGEQTTADGLVYRGVANDTNVITPFSDTSAYIILDTVDSKFYHYNRTTTYWALAGGGVSVTSFSGGSTGLTPSEATTGAVTLGGTLAVANGGTGTGTAFTTGSVVFAGASGTYTQDNSNLFWNNSTKRLGIGTSSPAYALDVIEDDEPSQTNVFAIARFTGSNTSSNDINIIGPATSSIRINYGRVGKGQDGEMGYSNLTRSFRLVSAGLETARFDSLQRVGIGTPNPTERLHVSENARIQGNILVGRSSATARIHIASGTATAETAPLKFTSGSLMNNAEAGAMEFNGTNLFFTPSTKRHTVNHGLTGSATLDFPSTTTLLSADLTITFDGAAAGDVVSLGVPNAAVNANTCYTAWVSAANTVTVRFNNYSSGTVDPASALFKVFVTK